MEKYSLKLFLFLLTAGHICKCAAQKMPTIGYPDTTRVFKLDTVFKHVWVDGKFVAIKILHDRYDPEHKSYEQVGPDDCYNADLTLLISDEKSKKNSYMKKFKHAPNDRPYVSYSLYKCKDQRLSDSGRIYFMMNETYCGSGSRYIWYSIELDKGVIHLTELMEPTGRSAGLIYNKNDKEVLLIVGLWAQSDSEMSLPGHLYRISLCKYDSSQHSFSRHEIGVTRQRYPTIDEDNSELQVLREIKKREPGILGSVNVGEYVLPNEPRFYEKLK